MSESLDLKCHFCRQPIAPAELHHHHLVAIADGGEEAGQQVECHAACHQQHHRDNGDYSRWRSMDYAEKVRTFGAVEVHRILSSYGKKGYVKATNGDARAWHRAGGLARARGPQGGTRRDARGRFVPAAQE